MQKLFLFLFSLLVFQIFAQTPPTEFETTVPGTYTTANAVSGWTISSGNNDPLTGAACSGSISNLIPGSPEFSVVSTPIIGQTYPGLPQLFSIDYLTILNSPLGGNQVVRMNDSQMGSLATRMQKSVVVNANTSLFTIAYCGSWDKVQHPTCCDLPGFILRVLDAQNNPINCLTYSLSPAAASCPSTVPGSLTGNVTWTNWATQTVDLSSFLGTTVTIEVINTDCTAGAHYGSVYFDMIFGNYLLGPLPYNWVQDYKNAVSFCPGSNLATINAPLGYSTYSWTAPPLYPVAASSATLSVLTITNAVAGNVYTLNLTSASGCQFISTYTLATSQVSIAAVSSNSSCANGGSGTSTVIAVGSAAGYNYSWTNSNNSIVGTNSIVTNLPSGIYNVSVTAINSVGCGYASTSVTIGTLQASIPTSIVKPFCGGVSVLNAPPNSTNIRWYVNSTSITAVMGGTVSPYNATSVSNGQIYQLGYSTPQGCRDSLIFVMSLVPSGTVSANNVAYACPAVANGSASIVINPSPFASGSSNTLSLLSSSPFQPPMNLILGTSTVFAAGSLAPGTYTVIGSDGICTFTTGFSVNVFSFNPQLNSSAAICPNSTTLIGLTFTSAISPNQYSFAWTPTTNISGGPTSTANIAIMLTNPSPQSPPVTTVYSVVITPSVVNCPVTRTIAVLFSNGQAPVISPIPELCTNTGTYAINSSPANGTYSTGAGNWLSNSGIIQSNFITASGIYTINYTSPGGCSVSTASVTVSKFNTAALTSSLLTTCNNSSCFNLMSLAQNTANGIWTGTSVTSNTFCPFNLSPGSYSLIYATTSTPNASLCPDSKTLTVNITNPQTVTLTPMGNLCNASPPIQLSVLPSGGSFVPTAYLSASGVFSPALGAIGANLVQYVGNCLATTSIQVFVEAFVAPTLTLTSMSTCENSLPFDMMSLAVNPGGNWAGPGIIGSFFNPATSGTGTLLLTYMTSSSPSNLCPAQQIFSISVYPEPNISIQGQNLVCLGEVITLQASGANTYSWSTGFNGSSFTFSPAITNTYMVTGTSPFNCSASQVILVTVVSCTGLDEKNSDGSVSIYPNPGSGIFYIEIPSTTKISITDAFGKIILEEVLNPGKQRVDLSKFSNGIYYINFMEGRRINTTKLIKQ